MIERRRHLERERDELQAALAEAQAYIVELHRWIEAPHPDQPGAREEAKKLVEQLRALRDPGFIAR